MAENPLLPVSSSAFLPYPVSTLSPKIVPNDLTSFKSRGLSSVERDMQQKLKELHEEYVEAVEHFNWNKLVYEAQIQFEPIVGETYHLYQIRGEYVLSMISPEQWAQKHIGSFILNVDRQFELVEKGVDVNSRSIFGFCDKRDVGNRM